MKCTEYQDESGDHRRTNGVGKTMRQPMIDPNVGQRYVVRTKFDLLQHVHFIFMNILFGPPILLHLRIEEKQNEKL